MRRLLLSLLAPAGIAGASLTLAAPAFAQDQPLPPLPSQAPQYAPQPPPPGYYPPPPQQQPYYQQQQQPYYQQPPPPPYYQPQPYYAQPPPPHYAVVPEDVPAHAPKFSLWTGVRLGYLGFGGGWFGFGQYSQTETTGMLVGNGPTFEVDVGARLAKRFIPYVYYEHAFLQTGHQFDHAPNASASSEMYGVGFRYVSGDVDSVGFVSELSIGERTVAVSDGSNTFKMSSLEYFKLGLGAEIRVTTLFTVTPLVSIATGSMTDASGSLNLTGTGLQTGELPPGGSQINDQRDYVVVAFNIGGHFDVFGK